MSSLVDGLLNLQGPLAYTLIGVLVFGEAAIFLGFVLPGETAVVLGGVLAAQGHLHLLRLLVLVVLAAIVGDSVGYEVGRHFGPRVLHSRLLRRHERRLEGAQTFLRERGGSAVFLGRFTAFLRAVTPGLAGVSRMPYGRFLAFNAAGGLAWGTGFTLLGYFAGQSYAQVERTVGRTSAAITAAVVVAVLVVVLIRRHRRSRPGEPADRSSAAAGGP